jgi:hypothetical protein
MRHYRDRKASIAVLISQLEQSIPKRRRLTVTPTRQTVRAEELIRQQTKKDKEQRAEFNQEFTLKAVQLGHCTLIIAEDTEDQVCGYECLLPHAPRVKSVIDRGSPYYLWRHFKQNHTSSTPTKNYFAIITAAVIHQVSVTEAAALKLARHQQPVVQTPLIIRATIEESALTVPAATIVLSPPKFILFFFIKSKKPQNQKKTQHPCTISTTFRQNMHVQKTKIKNTDTAKNHTLSAMKPAISSFTTQTRLTLNAPSPAIWFTSKTKVKHLRRMQFPHATTHSIKYQRTMYSIRMK